MSAYSDGLDLAKAYQKRELVGWAEYHQPGLAKSAFELLRSNFTPFQILNQTRPTAGRKMMLYLATRKLFKCQTAVPEYYRQEIGDCTVGGTLVSMADGSEKPIEQVKTGDFVLSHQNRSCRVLRTIRKSYSGNLVTLHAKGHNRSITATPDHEFVNISFGEIDWEPVGEIGRGDKVLIPVRSRQLVMAGSYGYATDDASVVEVDRTVRQHVANVRVYCLEVEDDHSFIANGYAISNCVSFGSRHGTELCSICDILIRGEREKFRSVFPPYYYGTGRVYVGGGQLGSGDGSLGSWMAEAVMKYGTLFSDEPEAPKYSGRVAKEWGNSRSVLDKWKPTATNFPIKSATQIKSWDELVAAICNGYACPTASDVGYDMEASSDGFHRQTTNWAHQMAWIGVDDGYKNGEDPYAILLNNWDDCHGHLKDFDDSHDLPIGVLRVRRKDVEKHIRAGETYSYSGFQGMPERDLDKALFMLV